MIVFNNWQISCTGVIAQQYDNLTRKVEVVGDLPDGYEWSLLVECNGNKDTLRMERTGNGAEVILSQDNLSVSGYYKLQLRGNLVEDTSKTRHTNVTNTFVPASLIGTGGWPNVPSEFLQIEQRILDANLHPPVPGDNGFWYLWNGMEYAMSDIKVPVDPNGYSLYYTSEKVRVQTPEMSVDLVEKGYFDTLRNGDFVITPDGYFYKVLNVRDDGKFIASLRCVLKGDPGNILTAPNGTQYQLAVDNNGNLTTTEVID